jgi:hypothetical protein
MDPAMFVAWPIPVLAVGDPRRPVVRRTIVGTLLTAALFVGFAFVSKEVPPLAAHAPWQDDPCDAVISFTLFFVPLAAALVLLRALLCRRDSPLPVARVVGLVRACRVVLGAVLVTLAADWISVALRAHREDWDAATGVLVGLLAATTLVAAAATVELFRAARQAPRSPSALRSPATPGTPDALADALLLAERWSRRLGPASPVGSLLAWLDRRVATAVRRHPLVAAVLPSAAFGLALAGSAAVDDGIGPALALFFGVGTCGMFAFLVGAGSYVGLVHAERPLQGARRRVADAAVIAAAAVPGAVGFRSSLWWLIGTTDGRAGLAELEVLLAIVAVATFAVALVVETMAGIHEERGAAAGADPG